MDTEKEIKNKKYIYILNTIKGDWKKDKIKKK